MLPAMFTSRPVPSPLAPPPPLGPLPLTGALQGSQPSGPALPLLTNNADGEPVLADALRRTHAWRVTLGAGVLGGLELPQYTTVALSGVAGPRAGWMGWDQDAARVVVWNGSAYVQLGWAAANATQLQGRNLSSTAPTDGQLLGWNHGASRWEPVSFAGGSPTTTRGDLIVRGVAADVRLPIGSADRLLVSDGTDPAWTTFAYVLNAFASTRGDILRRGAAGWNALNAAGLNTFLGGDGADIAVRTVPQVRTSLGLDAREEAGSPPPLLWWKMDETDVTDTTVANSGSVGSADGTITSGTPGAQGPWGEPAVQLHMAGYIRAPVDVVRPTAAITVSLWFRQPNAGIARLFLREYVAAGWGPPYASIHAYLDAAGVLTCAVNFGGAEIGAGNLLYFARPGIWHHCVLTYDGANIKTYVDGVLTATTAHVGTIDYGASPELSRWHVGGNPLAGGEYLNGEVADFRVYDTAQDAAWVERVYQRGMHTYSGS